MIDAIVLELEQDSLLTFGNQNDLVDASRPMGHEQDPATVR